MSQLALQMRPRLAYAPDNFLLHSGVRQVCESVEQLLSREEFATCFVSGGPRSGKTHLSVKLAGDLSVQGSYVQFLSGQEFLEGFSSEGEERVFGADVLIVDEADDFFRMIGPGSSGKFVKLVEERRVGGKRMVFLSGEFYDSFPCDDHVLSRLREAHTFHITPPAEDEVAAIVAAMGRQRGMSLTERHSQYLTRRLGRDLQSIERFLENALRLAEVTGRPIKLPLISDAL